METYLNLTKFIIGGTYMKTILKKETKQETSPIIEATQTFKFNEEAESQNRRNNIHALESFLSKAQDMPVTIINNGIRFFEELDWNYTQDFKTIIIQDACEDKIFGTLEIDLDDLYSVGEMIFQEGILVIDKMNGDTINISID